MAVVPPPRRDVNAVAVSSGAAGVEGYADASRCNGGCVGTPCEIPYFGEGTTRVRITCWFVKAGDTVQKFENLCVVESDEDVLELGSPYTGTVTSIVGNAGDIMSVASVICHILEVDGALPGDSTSVSAGTCIRGAVANGEVKMPMSSKLPRGTKRKQYHRHGSAKFWTSFLKALSSILRYRIFDEGVQHVDGWVPLSWASIRIDLDHYLGDLREAVDATSDGTHVDKFELRTWCNVEWIRAVPGFCRASSASARASVGRWKVNQESSWDGMYGSRQETTKFDRRQPFIASWWKKKDTSWWQEEKYK